MSSVQKWKGTREILKPKPLKKNTRPKIVRGEACNNDAISSKYIIEGFTTDQAIMFLPAEAIFAEINAYHPDLIDYSYKKHVWITSPTTLISTLTVIEMIIKNIERDKYTSIIHEELNRLGVEFSRYKDRWDKLTRSIDAVSKDVSDINITTDKITKRFEAINKVDVAVIDHKE